MQDMFNYSIFGNTLLGYLTSLGIFLGGMAVVYVFKRYVLARLKNMAESTDTSADDLLTSTIEKSLVPAFYFGSLYIALHTLVLSPRFDRGLEIAAIILATVLFVKAVTFAASFGLQTYLEKSGQSTAGEKQLRGIRGLVNIAIWARALVFLLGNLWRKNIGCRCAARDRDRGHRSCFGSPGHSG
jgi:hypothetical protein